MWTRIGLIGLDVFMMSSAWLLSFHFVLNTQTLTYNMIESRFALPVLCSIKILVFARLGLYKAILRYASFHFARTIVKAVTLGSFFSYLIINLSPNEWPFSVFSIDWLLTLFFIGGSRFLPRYFSETSRAEIGPERRVLIYGAGDLGDAVARTLLTHKSGYNPVGFLDDDSKKRGKKLHNLPILGNRDELASILKKNGIQEIVIAYRSIPSDWLRGIIKECRTHHVFCRIAPKISDMMNHNVNMKNIDIADLLKRDPKDLDEGQIDRFLRRKRILITGAAGSIGSELARQALKFRPKSIILLDRSEFGLYQLESEFEKHIESMKPYCRLKFVLQDICQSEQINDLVQKERPNIIFHAAAYKHVPLLEANPFSGLLNNLRGTMNIADAANQFSVEKFVLISTDKAVRPTSVMGVSKRICELYVQNLNLRSQTEYVAVRFGNVLGSSGSVVPKFLNQINQGGPITVTHPAVTRFFMLTQEAVQLVMQAASIGHGGEIFILNMGSPVKIKEMAEDLIFLAGKEPYKDIDIHFTGLRPGEKLYEEVLIDDTEKKTQYENITIGRMTFIEWGKLIGRIRDIVEAATQKDKPGLLSHIKDLVPDFSHVDLPPPQASSHQVFTLPIHKAVQSD